MIRSSYLATNVIYFWVFSRINTIRSSVFWRWQPGLMSSCRSHGGRSEQVLVVYECWISACPSEAVRLPEIFVPYYNRIICVLRGTNTIPQPCATCPVLSIMAAPSSTTRFPGDSESSAQGFHHRVCSRTCAGADPDLVPMNVGGGSSRY